MRATLFRVFRVLSRLVGGRGLGLYRIPLIQTTYKRLFRALSPAEGAVLADVHGCKLYVNTEDKTSRDSILVFGTHESYETSVVMSILRSGMTMVDVGANIGYYTVLSAKLVGAQGCVYAIEPDAVNYSFLLRNIEVNGFINVKPFQTALSESEGTAVLHLSDHLGSHSLAPVASGRTVEVSVSTLDLLPGLLEGGVHLVKIDAQGAEAHILRGGTKMFERWRPTVLMEFEPQCLNAMGTDGADMLKWIEHKLGYEIVIVASDERRLISSNASAILQASQHTPLLNLLLRPRYK